MNILNRRNAILGSISTSILHLFTWKKDNLISQWKLCQVNSPYNKGFFVKFNDQEEICEVFVPFVEDDYLKTIANYGHLFEGEYKYILKNKKNNLYGLISMHKPAINLNLMEI